MDLKTVSYQNIQDFFYSNFGLIYQYEQKLDHLFLKEEVNFLDQLESIYELEPVFMNWKGFEFPVFIHNNHNEIMSAEGEISFDIALNTFVFLSGWLELKSELKDQHDRFPFKASLQHKYSFTTTPVVSIYFEILFENAKKNGISIKKKPIKESLIYTHDIDQFRSGWFENIIFYKDNFSIKSLYEIPKNIIVKLFGLKDDYYIGMQKMLAIDKENNIPAISFFIPVKSAKDADFHFNDKNFESILKDSSKTQEIGLHPGYETYNNLENFKAQKEILEVFFDKKVTKSRQHFLRYNMEFTPHIIAKSGIKEDYTLGFAEQYGFRNGIAHPFYLYNFKTDSCFEFLSVPLVFMDVSFTHYAKLSFEEREEKFNELIDFFTKTKKYFPTKLSVLFHNSVFSDTKFKGFTAFYKRIMFR